MTISATHTARVRRLGHANPFALDREERGLAGANPPDNMYGGCSLQTFDSNTGAGNLSNTHADANGFLNYANQFDQIDFHFEDGGVQEWQYDPTFDDWQNHYGMDAVRAFYHSGHGGMQADGTFFAPLGAQWNGQDYAISSAMSLGDQFLRYLFWSTCNSVEVLDGQSPIRTWNPVNHGMRMIFGFQSTSVDSPDYGQNFFNEWNKGKSFSQAWQDASLDISNGQQVSSTACGATQAECQDRLWNERLFYGGAASTAWYWWRWAGNVPGSAHRSANHKLPTAPGVLRLARHAADARTLGALLERYELSSDGEVPDGYGAVEVQSHDRRLVVQRDGSHELFLAEPDRTAPLAHHEELRAAAQDAIARYRVADGLDLVYDRMTATHHAGGSVDGDVSQAQIADVTVHYRQAVDGVPAATGGTGHVRITLDPSAAVVRILDRTQPIADVVAAPPGSDAFADPETALAKATQIRLRELSANGVLPDRVQTVPDTTEVGYRLRAGHGLVVARREIEVTTGRFRKRHIIEVAL